MRNHKTLSWEYKQSNQRHTETRTVVDLYNVNTYGKIAKKVCLLDTMDMILYLLNTVNDVQEKTQWHTTFWFLMPMYCFFVNDRDLGSFFVRRQQSHDLERFLGNDGEPIPGSNNVFGFPRKNAPKKLDDDKEQIERVCDPVFNIASMTRSLWQKKRIPL